MIRVFVAPVPFGDGSGLTESLKNEIESCKSESLKLQKASAYSLLAYAAKAVYGNDICGFTKNPQGKPSLPYCRVSLSHTDGAVAVALSDGEAGVDIESLANSRYSPALAKRTMTAEENAEIAAAAGRENGAFLRFWTAKESLFKRSGAGAFSPQNTVVKGSGVKSFAVTLNGDFVLSVAGEGQAEITVLGGAYFEV